MSNAKPLGIILKALFRNRLRFSADATSGKKALTFIGFGTIYLAILMFAVLISIFVGSALAASGAAWAFYFMLLLTGALFVFIFGIINLVSTLYLSKDTDFYSVLPVKSTTVFAAKMLYVYLTEAVIAVGVILPAAVVYGITIKAWAWYYVITLATVLITPALPLMIASIISVPVMYIAGKLKNRSVVTLVLYIVLFVGFFAAYMYFIFAMNNMTDIDITEKQLASIAKTMTVMGNVLYPYLALSSAALGTPMYGLDTGASTAINLVIFVGSSLVLIGIVLLLSKLMYSQSVKANNQTDTSKAKKSEYRTTGTLKALVKREFNLALRTTQTAFQCFSVYFLPAIMAVVFSILWKNAFSMPEDAELATNPNNIFFIVCGVLVAMSASVGNAAITSFSREGTAIASLKVLPVDGKTVVKAKMLAWGIPSVIAVIVAVVVANAFSFQVVRFVISIILFSAFILAYTFFGIMWDLMSPKLKWNNPIEAVKGNTHSSIGMIIVMCVSFVLMIAAIVMYFFNVGDIVFNAVFWVAFLIETGIIFIIDVILYKNAEAYYGRMEL